MRNLLILLVFVLLALAVYFWLKCRDCEKISEGSKKTEVSGKVVSVDGVVIENANVEIIALTAERKEIKRVSGRVSGDGSFTIDAGLSEAPIFVVNITAERYSDVSKVFRNKIPPYRYTLSTATRVTINPANANTVTDSQQHCATALDSAALQFARKSTRTPFHVDSKGRLVGLGIPSELRQAYDNLFSPMCAWGSAFEIQGGSFGTQSGQPVDASAIDVDISTINLYARDGMPGDNTARNREDEGRMISYGAVTINAYLKGEKLKLIKPAVVQIPIDRSVRTFKKREVADSIPFLTYDPNTGQWVQEGYAKLNKERTAYRKQITHLSQFNLDYITTGGSCLKLDGSALSGGADINVMLVFSSSSPANVVAHNAASCMMGCDCRHFFMRLPPDEAVGVLAMQGSQVVGNYVVYTEPAGAGYGSMSIMCIDSEKCIPTEVPDFLAGRLSPGIVNNGLPLYTSSSSSSSDVFADCDQLTSPTNAPSPCMFMQPVTTVASGPNAGKVDKVELTWFFTFKDGTSNNLQLLRSDDGGLNFTPIGVIVTDKTFNNVGGTQSKLQTVRIDLAGATARFKVAAFETMPTCTPDYGTCPDPTCFTCSNEIVVNP